MTRDDFKKDVEARGFDVALDSVIKAATAVLKKLSVEERDTLDVLFSIHVITASASALGIMKEGK
jgi:hypothetical protein